MTAPRCEAEWRPGLRCILPAAWTVRIHSPVEGHAPDDTAWRVLCRDHALKLLKWIQRMETSGDTVWCHICNCQLQPREWLIEDQDMDILGWIEWNTAREQGTP